MLAMQSTLLPRGVRAGARREGQPRERRQGRAREGLGEGRAEYEAANEAAPSADALDGLANAHYQQKHDAEAYAAYEVAEDLRREGAAREEGAAEARLKELAARTGLLSIDGGESGATVTVDDKPSGRRRSRRRCGSRPGRIAYGSRRTASCRSISRRTSPQARRPRWR